MKRILRIINIRRKSPIECQTKRPLAMKRARVKLLHKKIKRWWMQRKAIKSLERHNKKIMQLRKVKKGEDYRQKASQ